MNTRSVYISQFDTLTKFHRGVSNAEALVMVKMLKDGYDLCIVNDDNDILLITRWEVTRTDGSGQIMGVSESEYDQCKANNFQPIS